MKPLIFFLFTFLIFIAFSIADTVTRSATPTTVWWNDSITVSGIANYTNGQPIAGANVNITVGPKRCDNTTNSNGAYNCTVQAPYELGTYTLLVNVTNTTGSSVVNSTSLAVKLNYGNTPIGTGDRAVYETPMLIQEPSGRIRTVFVRVLVWEA